MKTISDLTTALLNSQIKVISSYSSLPFPKSRLPPGLKSIKAWNSMKNAVSDMIMHIRSVSTRLVTEICLHREVEVAQRLKSVMCRYERQKWGLILGYTDLESRPVLVSQKIPALIICLPNWRYCYLLMELSSNALGNILNDITELTILQVMKFLTLKTFSKQD